VRVRPQETGWLEWDPFQGWEASQASFEADLSDPESRGPAESALPPAVEADDARMTPEGFTIWF